MTKKIADPAEPVVEPAPTDPPADPPGMPPGTVSLTKEEHDRLQADARTAKRKLATLEEANTAREAADEAEAARAAGDFDKALRVGREETERLQGQLSLRDVTDAVRDEISSLGYSGSRAGGLQRLVDAKAIATVEGAPDPDGVTAAVAATIAQYPDLFQIEGSETPGAEEEEKGMRRTPGPAAPTKASLDAKPPDYIAPEAYASYPHEVRMTPEFQERVRKSRPHWPKKVPATSFSVDQG